MPEGQTTQLRKVLKEELKTFHEETLMPAFGAYTEQVVLPAIEGVEERLTSEIGKLRADMGKLRTDMIDFITKQNADLKAEILQAIREDKKKDQLFKMTIIEILEQNHLGNSEQLSLLRELVAGGKREEVEKHFA